MSFNYIPMIYCPISYDMWVCYQYVGFFMYSLASEKCTSMLHSYFILYTRQLYTSIPFSQTVKW